MVVVKTPEADPWSNFTRQLQLNTWLACLAFLLVTPLLYHLLASSSPLVFLSSLYESWFTVHALTFNQGGCVGVYVHFPRRHVQSVKTRYTHIKRRIPDTCFVLWNHCRYLAGMAASCWPVNQILLIQGVILLTSNKWNRDLATLENISYRKKLLELPNTAGKWVINRLCREVTSVLAA